MSVLDVLSAVSLGTGAFFFITGTVGLARFPDLYSRLHAITKADNLGLGLTVLGLLLHARDGLEAFKLVLVWLFVLTASACVCFLVANDALSRERVSADEEA